MSKGYKNQGLARVIDEEGVESLYFKDGNTYNISKTNDVDNDIFSINKFYNKLFVPLLNMTNSVFDTQRINEKNSLIVAPLTVDKDINEIKDIKGIEYLDKLHTKNINSVGVVISDKKIDDTLVETSRLLDKTTIKTAASEINLNIYLNKFAVANGTVDVIWVEYDFKNVKDVNTENIIKQELFNGLSKTDTIYNFGNYKNVLLLGNNNLFMQVKPKDISSNMTEILFDTFGFIPMLVYTDRLNVIDDINKENPSRIIIDMLSAA
jgi:hypothetical protein